MALNYIKCRVPELGTGRNLTNELQLQPNSAMAGLQGSDLIITTNSDAFAVHIW
jgi:hypothetical protein